MIKRLVIVSMMIIVSIITVVILKNSDITYAAGTTLADTVISQNKGSSWDADFEESANGVYYTNSHEYRYIGADVNNYVSFNDDLYRIIGVFDSNTHGVSANLVKLIRARSIGSFSKGNTNNWAASDAYTKVLFNEYFYNKTDGDGTCSNYSYYSFTSTSKTEHCDMFIVYGIKEELRNYIETVTWHIRGYTTNTLTKQNFYSCERGKYSGCASGNTGSYTATLSAKIGLLYVSDFLYASGQSASDDTITGDSYNWAGKNWLYNGFEWTIMPQTDDSLASFYINRNGYVATTDNDYSYNVRPTFYLKSGVYVTGGNGSPTNPYTIACDNCG